MLLYDKKNNIVTYIEDNNKELDSKFLKRYEARLPMKRMGKTTEVASCILFLVSDASSYVTGEIFTADGGWSII